MNSVRPPALNLGPPIAKPRKRNSHAHIAKPQINSTPRNPISIIQSPPQQKGNLHSSGSFDLGKYLKYHEPTGKSDDLFMNALSKKPHLRKIGNSSSERRRFSIDLSDVSKSTGLASDMVHSGRKIQHSSSFRKTRFSMDNHACNDSPLAFGDDYTPQEEDEGQLIVILVHSNWGAPDYLRISSISILDDKFMAVPVLKSTTSPDLGLDTSILFDGHLIKREINELFSVPLKSIQNEPLKIAIIVPSEISISGVRVFNSEIAMGSSVKDISISLDNTNTLNGEIPKNFGIDFKFTQEMRQDAIQSSRLIEDYFNENREKSFQDKFGVYPLFETKTLSFELRKSWTDKNFVGLNGIQIFDQYNKQISMDAVDDIIVHNCGSSNDASLLMKNDLITSRPERQFLTKTLNGKSPLIEIVFKEPRFLSRIIIWNFNSSREPVEYGAKYIKICSDENVIWLGKINKAIGNEISAERKIKTIWLTDSMELRNQFIYGNDEGVNQFTY